MQHDDAPETPAPGTRVRFAYEDPQMLDRTAQVFKAARKRRQAREAADRAASAVEGRQ